eukprot:m.1074301 g.1074301  ORF g.1074301 m.1074301 type:complete len:276 (+) comp24238_c0_seq13:1609-2436(+)
MPLVMMCGFPSSGKTTVANSIAAAAQAAGMKVEIVRDTDVGYDPRDHSSSSAQEKPARAHIKACAERQLSSTTIVIVDSLNYIKGYRYELYCAARSLKTPSCVVHVATSDTTSAQWNAKREKPYADDIFKALLMRFEFPDDRQRWDKPCFTIAEGEEPPCDAILQALTSPDAKGPNNSTKSQPLLAPTQLHDVERVSQTIITALVQAQSTAVPGDRIAVPETDERVKLVKKTTMSELRRIRRQFTTYTKSHPIEGSVNRIATLFVEFLNNALAAQ